MMMLCHGVFGLTQKTGRLPNADGLKPESQVWMNTFHLIMKRNCQTNANLNEHYHNCGLKVVINNEIQIKNVY